MRNVIQPKEVKNKKIKIHGNQKEKKENTNINNTLFNHKIHVHQEVGLCNGVDTHTQDL